jgi:hypothetical protein
MDSEADAVATAQASKPPDTAQASKPPDTAQASKPPDTAQASKPPDMAQASKPPDMAQASKEAVLAALSEAIEILSRVKARLPVLLALVKELDRIAGGRPVPARNSLVLQMARDSFDMLVIDLNSLRERMISFQPPGVFKIVEAHCRLFHRFTADDVKVEGMFLGPAEHNPVFLNSFRDKMLRLWNEVFDRVFPGRKRVRENHVEALRLQFKKETEPTAEDRNKVRAHRYEHHASTVPFQPPSMVEEQVKVFERYLNDLLFLTNRSQHGMSWPDTGDANTTAEDLADLVVFGSINLATLGYGMAPKKHGEGEPPWYWYYREKFYKAGNQVADSGDEEDSATATEPV